MFQAKICVFKEIQINNQTCYEWFRPATEDEEGHITVAEVLSEDELWQRLASD